MEVLEAVAFVAAAAAVNLLLSDLPPSAGPEKFDLGQKRAERRKEGIEFQDNVTHTSRVLSVRTLVQNKERICDKTCFSQLPDLTFVHTIYSLPLPQDLSY